ncbi:hypothetical protein DAI22_04g093601 [Oryza sativa Japonica Group]|nr:hypothetical protein DAI22_04g093601 [Oryza sativa Japonica Group]
MMHFGAVLKKTYICRDCRKHMLQVLNHGPAYIIKELWLEKLTALLNVFIY